MADLNPAQLAAVEFGDGPLSIAAGAGSGKTRVITHRIAKMLGRGVVPARILAVTFTNKASSEMRHRIAKLVGEDKAARLWMGTFHSVACRLMRSFPPEHLEGRKTGFSIFDENDTERCVKAAIKELELDPKRVKFGDHRGKISKGKCRALRWQDIDDRDDDLAAEAKAIWRRYEEILIANNAFDFDDLLNVAMRAIESESELGLRLRAKWDYVLVDEFQDTSNVQCRIVLALSTKRNVTVVGDLDQALYSWRGAEPDNIVAFSRDHFKEAVSVDLLENYRSTRSIVECSNAYRKVGQARTNNSLGEKVIVRGFGDENAEARFLSQAIMARIAAGTPPSECAVLYRARHLSRAIEDELRNRGIRYQVVGGVGFYERKVVKDCLSYLRLAINQDSDLDFERIINLPARGLGDAAISKLRQKSRQLGRSLAATVQAALSEGVLNGKGEAGLTRFFHMYRAAEKTLGERSPGYLTRLAAQLIDGSGYRAHLTDQLNKYLSDKKIDEAKKAEQDALHIDQVIGAVDAYEKRVSEPTLEGYLQEVSLITSQDDMKGGKVTLSTIHGAKGLEWDAVWLAGCEAGVMPSAFLDADPEEERRVCFVACSRPRHALTITYAEERFKEGKPMVTGPSVFLDWLPVEFSEWPVRDQRKKLPQHVGAVVIPFPARRML